jgi:DNA-binding GntR family transcriptional regulator
MRTSEIEQDEFQQVSGPDVLTERLRQSILSGELPPGTPLRQGELSTRFGTSRIPIREALRHLAAEGLVTMHANRGFVVTALSLDQVLELLEIRIALECRALRLAMPNLVEEDLAEAERILSTYDAMADPSEWADMNWRFHRLLYAPCYLERLLALIETNYGQAGLFIRAQVSLATGKEQPQKDHWALLELCREGRTDEAVALLETHIARTQKSLRAALRRQR